MGLETGTGIGDLVPANPLSTDAVSSGDDHLRLIKTVMQSITFLKSIQTFTTSGTWTRPANIKHILVYCLGGGGGGNGSAGGTNNSGGGGSSGATAMAWLDVTTLATASVTVGAGGTGGTAGGGLGTDGQFTAFFTPPTSYFCAGREGKSGALYYHGGTVVDRSLSVGDIIFTGAGGSRGNPPIPSVTVWGGTGGGAGGVASTAALPNSGGGGAGGDCNPGSGSAGGNGGSGYCIIFEFGW